jgi:myo-inositol-1(or 4)-monophosphatase
MSASDESQGNLQKAASAPAASHAERRALLATCVAAAARSADVVRDGAERRSTLEWEAKGRFDFVSDVDRDSESALAEVIAQRHPDATLLAEEGSPQAAMTRGLVFVADPLDGTTNFLHGVPHFAISIGLEREGEIIAGVIYQPISDELFWAEKGNGAFVDTPNARSRRLRVSGRKDPARALVATGIPNIGKRDHGEYHRRLEAVTRQTAGVRRWGAASLDFAFLAAGRYDAFFEYGLAPWDVAAGLLLVREAGGIVSDVTGKPYELGGPSLLASNFGMHEPMIGILGA